MGNVCEGDRTVQGENTNEGMITDLQKSKNNGNTDTIIKQEPQNILTDQQIIQVETEEQLVVNGKYIDDFNIVDKLNEQMNNIWTRQVQSRDEKIEMKFFQYNDDKSVYIGEWRGNQREGNGIYILDDGSKIYKGQWVADKRNGKGIEILQTGDYYEGEWKDDLYEGNGKLVQNDVISLGTYYQGMKHGNFRERIQGWEFFIGEYKSNKKVAGRQEFGNGDVYEGDFDNEEFCGYGIMKWKEDNSEYKGEFKNSNMHGTGIFTWADGKSYQGQYFEGVKQGKGKMTWPDGKQYDGEWKFGKMHGIGRYTDTKGKSGVYVWEEGARKAKYEEPKS